jgi:hypothetical protein
MATEKEWNVCMTTPACRTLAVLVYAHDGSGKDIVKHRIYHVHAYRSANHLIEEGDEEIERGVQIDLLVLPEGCETLAPLREHIPHGVIYALRVIPAPWPPAEDKKQLKPLMARLRARLLAWLPENRAKYGPLDWNMRVVDLEDGA